LLNIHQVLKKILPAMMFPLDDDRKVQHIEVMVIMIVLIYRE
jgi:hypothetical protein